MALTGIELNIGVETRALSVVVIPVVVVRGVWREGHLFRRSFPWGN